MFTEGSYGGIATVRGAHSVCCVGYVASAYVYVHETGHNLGCDHQTRIFHGDSGTTYSTIMRSSGNGGADMVLQYFATSV